MKISIGTRSPRLMRWRLSLLLIAAIAVSGCGGEDTSAPEPSVAPTAAAKTAAPAPSALSDGAIPIPSGGFLVVPAGALPKGTKVDVVVTQMPVLPDDVEPVGEAIAITAAAQPSKPVMLRLPIPAGVADPAELVIVRVEPDGATTFLITQVEDRTLTAYTPGFSTYAIGKAKAQRLILHGPTHLLPAQRAMFRVYDAMGMMFGTVARGFWQLSGPAKILHQNSTSVTIEASSEEVELQLIYECIDPGGGGRWWGSTRIVVSDDPGPGEGELRLSAYTQQAVVYADKEVRIRAEISGKYTPPITWRWDYGDGTPEATATTQKDERMLDLPPKVFAPKSIGYYPVIIQAQDSAGRSAWTEVLIHARAQATTLNVEGPLQIEWESPGALRSYKATASIGRNTVLYGRDREYRFDWELLPQGDEHSATLYAAAAGGNYATGSPFVFKEPGEHRLKVVLINATRGEAVEGKVVLPIQVTGGQRLSGYVEDMPASARPDEQVSVKFQIRGGILVLAGKKSGYTVQVDWGDGSPLMVEKNVGAARTSSQGTAFALSHKWVRPDTYTVNFIAYDATGTSVRDARKITITDTASVVSPSTPTTNTPPVAEDISTSAKSGGTVPITLKGTDADGDTLTYSLATRPANGTLTGVAPFLTYKPKLGFSGTDTFTYKVRDGKAASPAATVRIVVEGLQWVRVGETLINATNPKAPTEYYGGGKTPGYFGEERFTGKFTIYRLSETLIAMDDREVDHGTEYWNITIESRFDTPPPVLTPGQVVPLSVKFSGSASAKEGWTPPGARFAYGTDKESRGIIQPADPLYFSPADPNGPDSKTWTLTVPQGTPGKTFQVWAFWWNCEVCNVVWTYRYGAD